MDTTNRPEGTVIGMPRKKGVLIRLKSPSITRMRSPRRKRRSSRRRR